MIRQRSEVTKAMKNATILRWVCIPLTVEPYNLTLVREMKLLSAFTDFLPTSQCPNYSAISNSYGRLIIAVVRPNAMAVCLGHSFIDA